MRSCARTHLRLQFTLMRLEGHRRRRRSLRGLRGACGTTLGRRMRTEKGRAERDAREHKVNLRHGVSLPRETMERMGARRVCQQSAVWIGHNPNCSGADAWRGGSIEFTSMEGRDGFIPPGNKWTDAPRQVARWSDIGNEATSRQGTALQKSPTWGSREMFPKLPNFLVCLRSLRGAHAAAEKPSEEKEA